MNAWTSRISALILLLVLSLPAVSTQQASGPFRIFEIEFPELNFPPTSSPDLIIPSTHVAMIAIHILNPHAERIDYGRISTFINGEATSTLHDSVAANDRGKVVRIDLRKRPGFELLPGRNTVEVQAVDRLNRKFYSSFVLRTATENRNQDFRYETQLAGDSYNRTPPELMMIEPERAIVMTSRKTVSIRFSGVATAATSVEQVLVDGVAAPLKRGSQGQRKLGLPFEDKRVTFEVSHNIKADASNVVVEAIDASGNRTRLNIPILAKGRSPTGFSGKKYALIIGVSNFLNNERGVKNLRYADRDADSIYKFLQSPAGGGFLPENMLLLLNENATLATIRGALSNFISRPGPDDLLLLFMATHGSPDPYSPQNLYFILHDTDPDRMSETGLAMRDFETSVRKRVTAKRVVMLFDACHSAGLAGPAGIIARGGNNLMNLYLEKMLYRDEGRAVITSSDVNEYSFEAEHLGGGHGVFTHFLLDGLRGKADENLDHLVSVGELFRFVRQKVQTETAFRQHPQILTGANEDLQLSRVGE